MEKSVLALVFGGDRSQGLGGGVADCAGDETMRKIVLMVGDKARTQAERELKRFEVELNRLLLDRSQSADVRERIAALMARVKRDDGGAGRH